MTDGARSPEEWALLYDELYPTYRAFTDKLDTLLGDLLYDEGAAYEWIYTWICSRDDLLRRLYRGLRRGEQIDDPFRELEEFAGVTIVVADLTSGEHVTDVVEREFAIDHDISLSFADAATRNVALTDARSGEVPTRYEFARYAASITDARAALPEWRPYEGLRTRVEVQTVLQYAAERLDRNLPYYEDASYPTEVRTLVVDLRALLASADSKFDKAWRRLDEIESRCADLVERGELPLELDGESLGAYLRASETVARLVATGLAAGLRADEDDYRPSRTGREQSTLWLLRRLGIRSIAELDDFLAVSEKRAESVLADLARVSSERGYQPWAIADSIVEWLLLILRRADPETVALMTYYEELEDAINTLIGNPVASRE